MITLKDLKKQKQNTNGVPIYRAKFYASIFNNIDRTGDMMLKGAFTNTLKDAEIPFVYGHDYNRPILAKCTLIEDDKGLLVTADIPYINDGKKYIDDYYNGVSYTHSFGFDYVDLDYNKENDCFLINEVIIYEVSTAAVPANPLARTISIEKL
jgi:HK97 family phage prohead protease